MGRIVIILSLLMTLVVCGGGGWLVSRPPLALVVVPGATAIQVDRQAWNEWQISYHAPGSPTTWFSDVGRQLEAHQWHSLASIQYGSLTNIYSHAVSLGVVDLWEWVYLAFDPLQPHRAHIRVRRWIVFHQWQRLLE